MLKRGDTTTSDSGDKPMHEVDDVVDLCLTDGKTVRVRVLEILHDGMEVRIEDPTHPNNGDILKLSIETIH